MRFNNVDKRGGWRKRFAFFPIEIGDETIWLEWYWSRFEGLYFNVRRIEDKPF